MKKDIRKIGSIVGKCYDFEDAWVGYNPEFDNLDIICAIHEPNENDICSLIKTKVSVHIAQEFGTRFVEKHCNISIINYL